MKQIKHRKTHHRAVLTTLALIVLVLLSLVLSEMTGITHIFSKNIATNSQTPAPNSNQPSSSSAPATSPSQPNSNPSTLNTTNQTPAINKPSDAASFPIENAHYRIERGTSDTSFNVTLYAVINNPSQYDEYIAQLKQYKQEASLYLSQRFGTNLTITWKPDDAQSL